MSMDGLWSRKYLVYNMYSICELLRLSQIDLPSHVVFLVLYSLHALGVYLCRFAVLYKASESPNTCIVRTSILAEGLN